MPDIHHAMPYPDDPQVCDDHGPSLAVVTLRVLYAIYTIYLLLALAQF